MQPQGPRLRSFLTSRREREDRVVRRFLVDHLAGTGHERPDWVVVEQVFLGDRDRGLDRECGRHEDGLSVLRLADPFGVVNADADDLGGRPLDAGLVVGHITLPWGSSTH